jgi:hypothetical protein
MGGGSRSGRRGEEMSGFNLSGTDLRFSDFRTMNVRNTGVTYFKFRRTTFLNQFKSKCGLLLAKASVLRVHLNLDGAPITSNSHTHPSHSQTSRLLTSSLSTLTYIFCLQLSHC